MHGEEFDTGPREKPWPMEGIGSAHFPITAKNPEVQRWFDQGNALLHSFWYYEAERAFRWCLKLEPENAMAYWGLARSAMDPARSDDFAREAIRRKNNVSPRERLYIETLEAGLPDPLAEKDDGPARNKRVKKVYETICLRYPDDMEARAYLALLNLGDDRFGCELMIREVLRNQPMHPGAHHYRIHNWDYHEPEQALQSCPQYTAIAPGIGHALHMPGHIYSIVGMWNEAAISMDSATRVEKRYMQARMTLPFNNWNYAHNRYYLSYIQGQLGMVESAIAGARDLIDAPVDPKYSTTLTYGLWGMARALCTYQRWDELLDSKNLPWRDDQFGDKVNKQYFEARAYFGKGNIEKAAKSVEAHTALKKDVDKNKQVEQTFNIHELELKARLALARGDTIYGLGLLAQAAQQEYDMQKGYADPPVYPESLYNSLGEAYLNAKSPALAAVAFEKALTLTRNDLFALSGLVRAYAATGDKEKARDAMSRLLYVTMNADTGIKPLVLAKAAGIQAEPRDSSPRPQRNYRSVPLEHLGPERWQPYGAPKLEVTDSGGKRVTLDEYRGKNVLLVFYLGQECAHCMRQLHDIGKKKDEWDSLDTAVLAVSSAPPAKNAAGLKELGALPVRLLSDTGFENARRFHSYDDFEQMELHSTILIDKLGRVYWARTGGDPFNDLPFIVKQLEKMNAGTAGATAGSSAAGGR